MSERVPNVTKETNGSPAEGKSVLSKSPRSKKGVKPNTKIPWAKEEDELLMKLITKHGLKSWATVASEMQNRVASQCGERWFNHLCPAISAKEWSSEEDEIILKGFAEVGGAWGVIAARIPGRSEVAIRTRFYNTLRKTAAAVAHGLGKLSLTAQRSWVTLPVDCMIHLAHCLGRSFAQWALLRVVCKAWYALSLNEQWLGALEGVVSTHMALKPLSGLIGLQTLEVSSHDYDLKFLASLSTLKTLHLANFKITHESLNLLSRLVALRKLCLRSCHGVYSFDGFSSLVELELIGCDVQNKALRNIAKLYDLHYLSFRGCYHITDVGIQFLSSLTRLESLDLALCPVVGKRVLASLESLPSLTSLCMEKIPVYDEGIEHLSCFKKLRHFNAQLSLTDAGLIHLVGLPWMENLELARCDITDGLPVLARMTQLKSLSLFACLRVLDLACLSLLTNLQTLDISSAHVGSSFSHLTSLTQLTMKGPLLFDETKGLSTLLQLQVLDLSNNHLITDDRLQRLSHLANLRILYLSSCRQVTGVGLAGFNALEELEICSCSFNEAGYTTLATLPRLRVVEASYVDWGSAFKTLQERGMIKLRQ